MDVDIEAVVGEKMSTKDFDAEIEKIQKAAEESRFWFMASRKEAETKNERG